MVHKKFLIHIRRNIFSAGMAVICLFVAFGCMYQRYKIPKIVCVDIGRIVREDLKRIDITKISDKQLQLETRDLVSGYRSYLSKIAQKSNLIIISKSVVIGNVEDITDKIINLNSHKTSGENNAKA